MSTNTVGETLCLSENMLNKAWRMKPLKKWQPDLEESEIIIPDSSVRTVLWTVRIPSESCKYENICLLLSEYTYRLDKASGVGLPKIPIHPIGYHDAESLLRWVSGRCEEF